MAAQAERRASTCTRAIKGVEFPLIREMRSSPFLTVPILMLMLASSLSSAFAVSANSEPATQADDAIERYRKGDIILSVLDDQGGPIVGAAVSYRQTTRGFLFGLPPQAPDESTWSLLKEAGVNYVEMFMSWKLTDDPGFLGWVDYTFTPYFLKRHGIVLLSGHCLVWMVASYPDNPAADPMNLPAWVTTLKYDELKEELYDHVYETVSRYKSLIKYWGINEPFWPYADPFHLTTPQWLEIVTLSVQAIKAADPTAKIYMNNPIGDFPTWNYYPIKNMKLLMDKGIDFDAIGLEVYGEDRSPGVPLDARRYPVVSWVSRRLDQFAELGKPIILTEIDVASEPSEKTQAEWLRDFYTMAFAKPYVKAIVWSFMFDNPFLPKAGIFDCQRQDQYGNCQLDPRPKQAYYALKNLTSSWLTEGNGTTDSQGQLRFRGFGGNYTITLNMEGYKATEGTIHVKEQTENSFEMRLTEEVQEIATTSATTTTSTSEQTLSGSPYAIAPPQMQMYAVVVGATVICLVLIALIWARKRIQ
jgi:hypothetical protein